jgi:hypothetical protein
MGLPVEHAGLRVRARVPEQDTEVIADARGGQVAGRQAPFRERERAAIGELGAARVAGAPAGAAEPLQPDDPARGGRPVSRRR